MAKENLMRALVEIGFKDMEAKIYCAVLDNPGATAYAVFIHLGAPRTHVYQAISEMLQKGYIMLVPAGKNQYQAVPIDVILEAQEREEAVAVGHITEVIQGLPIVDTGLDVLEMINDYEIAMHLFIHYINCAKENISIMLWRDSYTVAEPHLQQAVQRGVKLRLVASSTHATTFDCAFAQDVFQYDEDHSLQAQRGMHWLWMVVDNEIGAFGTIEQPGITNMIYTKNIPFLQILSDHIHYFFVYRDFTQKHGGADFLALDSGLRFELPR